jgi:mRNA-degrading endonuclease RelE of RelBE toxin-antitoxin system
VEGSLLTSWEIEYKPAAEKQSRDLDKKTRKKLKEALRELQHAEDPTSLSNVKAQSVTLYGDYWLTVDEWRVLFTPDRMRKLIYVFGIIPKDDVS